MKRERHSGDFGFRFRKCSKSAAIILKQSIVADLGSENVQNSCNHLLENFIIVERIMEEMVKPIFKVK
jgi:hypothetical protein